MSFFALLQTTANVNLASEETTNTINNFHTIVEIVVLLASIIIGAIKAFGYFSTENDHPRSLYFTQSYDVRLKKKKATRRVMVLLVSILYVALLILLCALGNIIYYEYFVIASFIIAFVALAIYFSFNMKAFLLSFQKRRCHVGNNEQLTKYYMNAFLFFFLFASFFGYAESFMIFWDFTYDYKTFVNKPLIKTSYPQFIVEAMQQDSTRIAWEVILIAGLCLGLWLILVLLFIGGMDEYRKDEKISLGYVFYKGNPSFIHYLEGENYVCSDYAYYNEYGSVMLYEKKWIANKKIYLLDPGLKNQIIDLYFYQIDMMEIETVPSEIKELVNKGQYKQLTDEEVETLNKWMDNQHNEKTKDSAKEPKTKGKEKVA